MATTGTGMTMIGALTRSVRDTALFLDAVDRTASRPTRTPRASRARCGSRTRRRCRAASSRGSETEQRGAVEATAERLRELGHTVERADPDYGDTAANVVTRYLEGIARRRGDGRTRERLARWTRGDGADGRADPRPARPRARTRRRRPTATALDRSSPTSTCCCTPAHRGVPPPVGEWLGLPAPRDAQRRWRNFTPYSPLWNHTGQPAAAVPAELDRRRASRSRVQLVGRPDDEATLLSLAAQLEAGDRWTERRPPLAA